MFPARCNSLFLFIGLTCYAVYMFIACHTVYMFITCHTVYIFMLDIFAFIMYDSFNDLVKRFSAKMESLLNTF